MTVVSPFTLIVRLLLAAMDVRLFNGTTKPSIEKRISLLGFTAAYEEYLQRIGE